ncbi:MAG: cation-translocating P-type ATPase, partial [Mycobacterium sp.]
MPLRAVAMGIQTLGSVASTGLTMAAIPVREGVRALSGELPGPPLTRHCWHGNNRAWIEVRGLDGPDGAERGRAVLGAVRAYPGVASATLNRPLSRIVVSLDGDRTSLHELCKVLDDTEWRVGPAAQGAGARRADRSARPKPLPGDGLLLATRAVTMGATATGMGVALTGRALRWPRLPASVEAVVAVVDYQPQLRRLLEDRIGLAATDTVLNVAMTAAHVVSLSPASLGVDLLMEIVKAAECRAEARAWRRHEPALAAHADQPDGHPPARPVPPGEGLVDRHARRSALVQAVGAAVVGAYTRSINMASTAALVATPKAMRTTREAFAATLGQGLADRHGVLPLHPPSLRRLDRVDVLLVDPRVLCTDTLRVVRVRGARDDELSAAWNRAQELLDEPGLRSGWHPVAGVSGRRPGKIEALICPAHDPLASAVLAEARHSDLDLTSVDVEALGELCSAFDELRPLDTGSVDDALTAALADLQQAGRTVAVLSSGGAQALSSADLGLGVMGNSDAAPPPWTADLIVSDLAGAWRVLHALPAARSASRRGVEISAGASALGALLMLPGVRGRGPGPVTTGAAAGLFSG